MRTGPDVKQDGGDAGANRRAYLLALVVTLAIALAAVWVFDRASRGVSLYMLGNFVGPTAHSLMQGKGLVVCSVGLGTVGNPICFHAGRMPVASAVVALGWRLLGDRYLAVGFFKALLMLAPLEAAIWLVCRRLPATRRAMSVGLLVLPFLLTPFLADVVNLQVEEGYSYSLLALAAALVLFRGREPLRWGRALGFAGATAGLYLAKSSMAPAAAVLAVAFLWPYRRQTRMVAGTLALLLLAPLGWGMWQQHAAGRFTFGTSVDGVNLHKGNEEGFLSHYPPLPGETLDRYDPAMNQGLHFNDEWSFNDYHQRAAVRFMREHPGATAEGDWRKLEVVLFSVRKLGSKPQRGALEVLETAGVVVFRVVFLVAGGLALWLVFGGQGGSLRYAAGAYLALVAAVALPYVVGFAYTRHISVLLYPAVLFLCRSLMSQPGNERRAKEST